MTEAGSVSYYCPIHDFHARLSGSMQQHINHDHPGGMAKDHVSEFEYRPPSEEVDQLKPVAHHDDLDRRVCPGPDCRLYFDVGSDSPRVFCSDACERRYEEWGIGGGS